MSLLNSKPTSSLTKAQKLTNAKNRILSFSVDNFNNLIKAQNDGIRLVWNNPELTPQEIIDKLGSDAIKIFQYHGALTELITQIAAVDGVDISSRLKYPTNAFTIDPQTGTITVDPNTPYTPS